MHQETLELAELKAAHALTPYPSDFEAFWKARMEEADNASLSWQIVPSTEVTSSALAHFFDLTFVGIDGAEVYAKYLRPQTASGVQTPLVLQFHGYPGASRSWFEQSSFLGLGCSLIALDNPGQGGRSLDGSSYKSTTVSGHLVLGLDGPVEDLYFVHLYQNIRLLCRIVRQLEGIDTDRVFVNGASQGGGIGLATCALNQDLINRAAILYPFLTDFRCVWELNADEVAYEGIRYYSRWFDADGSRVDEVFAKLAYIDSANFARLVTCPVLFGTGLDDPVVPPEAQFAAYNALTCPKRHLLYPGYAHEEIGDFDDKIIDFFCSDKGEQALEELDSSFPAQAEGEVKA